MYSMSTITMSTNTRPTRVTRRKRPPNPNWREDFYRNGRPDEQEVIVISDSPTPSSPMNIRQPPSQIETRGMKKRGRRSPPHLSNLQQLQSSQVPLQPISAVLTHKRRRRELQPNQIHQQYNDTSYRSYISASSHTSIHYREPISAREVSNI